MLLSPIAPALFSRPSIQDSLFDIRPGIEKIKSQNDQENRFPMVSD
jgi:hypothetical protein